MEEEKEEKLWRSPFSEISKMTQISILVEYEIGTELHSMQVDFPFVFKLQEEAILGTKFYKVLHHEVRKYALNNLYDQGVQKDAVEDITIRVVNQPEIFILTVDGPFDSKSFLDLLTTNDFKISELGKLMVDERINKKYYPKHVIFWNTKYSYYEKFTLQTFKMVDEVGRETLEGLWTGEYNRQSQQLSYGDLFDSAKNCHFEPALIIWEVFTNEEVRVSEISSIGKQTITVKEKRENPAKFQYVT